MAGHSKWANIKFRKAAQDAKRGKIFTKIIREITVAARMGGDDLDSNPRLRDAVNKALKANMKRDTIDNAIKRGAGGLDGADMNEMRYEGYGPGGTAVLVDCLSDNKNRTVSEVRHAFTKCGGNLGTDGSVSYLFNKQGQFHISDQNDEEKVMEIALENGAIDVINDGDGIITVVTEPENYQQFKTILDASQIETIEDGIVMQATTEVNLDQDTAESLMRLVDMLEDLDDVQDVYFNAVLPDNT